MSFYFALSFAIGIATLVLIISLHETVKIKFSKTKTKNAFTMKPYYLIDLYIFCSLIENSMRLNEQYYNITYGNQFAFFIID